MLNPIERIKIKLAVSLGWTMQGKLPEAIRNFQATEADGVWHLRRGMRLLADPRQKAIVFSHSIEEESHADEFTRAYHHYGARPMQPANYERADLYDPKSPAWKTFAFVHVGEHDATERFRLIHKELGNGVLKESLGKIVADEEGHVDLTHDLLLAMGATPGQIKREILKVRLKRAWDRWLRVGKGVVDIFATALLSLIYYVAGFFLFTAARRKLSSRFVEYDNNHLKKLSR